MSADRRPRVADAGGAAVTPAYSENYQLVSFKELDELRTRLTKAEKFVRTILLAWQAEDWGDLDGATVQEAARASGYQIDVPAGSHAECEWCEDGESVCAELRLPVEEMP